MSGEIERRLRALEQRNGQADQPEPDTEVFRFWGYTADQDPSEAVEIVEVRSHGGLLCRVRAEHWDAINAEPE